MVKDVLTLSARIEENQKRIVKMFSNVVLFPHQILLPPLVFKFCPKAEGSEEEGGMWEEEEEVGMAASCCGGGIRR